MPQQQPDPRWQGDLWLATDYCLIAGRAGHTDDHAHYPHQVLIAVEGSVEALVDGTLERGAVVPIESGRQHAILTEQPLLSLFAEPLAFELPALQHACEQAGAAPRQLIETLDELPRRPLQPRLAKALQRIRRLDADTLPAALLAREAALSISQLERLFSGQLGASVRRLVLWQRLRLALQLALSGTSLTTAAATAGFSDSAHLSRCIRRHFGIRADHSVRHLRLHVIG